METVYAVYVLYSESFDKHYTGYTSHLITRFYPHNMFGKDWTKNFRPWVVIYTEVYFDKSAARIREKFLKTGAGRDFIKALPHTF